jgi:hypothetical protein
VGGAKPALPYVQEEYDIGGPKSRVQMSKMRV